MGVIIIYTKNKETIKSFILSFLVISSLVLTANIWFVKELWSKDYNSFLYSFQNIFNFNDTYEDVVYKSEYSPVFVGITLNSKRTIAYIGSENYNDFFSVADSIMKNISKEGSYLEISDDDFSAVHKTNSMIIKFANDTELKVFLKNADVLPDTQTMPVSDSVVINIFDTSTKYLYFHDSISNKNYRISVKYSPVNTKKVTDITNNAQSLYYAFEVSLHKQTDNVERILFENFIPIEINDTTVMKLDASPIIYNNAKNSPYDPLFKAFNITKNSARASYIDKDNVINFIEKYSTFKIHKNGLYIYETNRDQAGINLSKNNRNERDEAIWFINELYRNAAPDSTAILKLDSVNNDKEITTYTFNYITDNGVLYFSDNSPAATMEVSNGIIISCKQHLLTIKPTANFGKISGMLETYNNMYQADIAKDLKIKNMFPANIYYPYGSNVGWVALLSDNSVYVAENPN